MKRKRIFFVEDNFIQATVLRNHLMQSNYELVGEATTGEQALPKILKVKPDLLIMDINLPGELNGIQTAAKTLESIDIPVIYLTAYGDIDTFEQAKSTKPMAYLLKPFRARELNFAIETAIVRHQREKKSRTQKFKTKQLKEIVQQTSASDANNNSPLQSIEIEVQPDRVHMFKMGKDFTQELSDHFNEKNILIIDNDIKNVYSLYALFEHHAANVLDAANDMQALDVIKDADVHLVIVQDAHTVVSSVSSLIKTIRSQEGLESIPVILLTPESNPTNQQATKLPAVRAFPKSVEPETILEAARAML